MAADQLTVDDLAYMGADELREAFEAGQLDTILGRGLPPPADSLEAEVRRKLDTPRTLEGALSEKFPNQETQT